jgi:DNA-binding CsgD family transcriptional regulator
MGGVIEHAWALAKEVERAPSPDAFADALVDQLFDLIPCDEVTFNDIDESEQRFVVLRTRTTLPLAYDFGDQDLWDVYDDLPYCKGFRPGESGVARMSDVMSRRELGRSPVHQDVLVPEDLRFSVELVLASPRPRRWAVLLGRADRDFTDRECDLLALLAPHLESAYRKARLRSLVSAREREVLALVGDGLTNREIARRLDISPGTVRAHLEHAYPKLGVSSRAAAVSIMR